MACEQVANIPEYPPAPLNELHANIILSQNIEFTKVKNVKNVKKFNVLTNAFDEINLSSLESALDGSLDSSLDSDLESSLEPERKEDLSLGRLLMCPINDRHKKSKKFNSVVPPRPVAYTGFNSWMAIRCPTGIITTVNSIDTSTQHLIVGELAYPNTVPIGISGPTNCYVNVDVNGICTLKPTAQTGLQCISVDTTYYRGDGVLPIALEVQIITPDITINNSGPEYSTITFQTGGLYLFNIIINTNSLFTNISGSASLVIVDDTDTVLQELFSTLLYSNFLAGSATGNFNFTYNMLPNYVCKLGFVVTAGTSGQSVNLAGDFTLITINKLN